MIQSPTNIHYRIQWQILYAGIREQLFDKKKFREFYDRINDEDTILVELKDFVDRLPQKCEMGTPRGQQDGGEAFTKLIYANDQLTLIEEWAEISVQDFTSNSSKILDIWFSLFPATAIVAQNCCIRSLAQPVNFNDSRIFLGDEVLGIGPDIRETFTGRPFQIGFTLSCERKLNLSPILIDTTVNSWRDNKTVWIQVNGNSPYNPPINATNTKSAVEPFNYCKDFLEREVINLLNKFDAKKNKNGG